MYPKSRAISPLMMHEEKERWMRAETEEMAQVMQPMPSAMPRRM